MSAPAVMKVEAASAAEGCALCGATADLQQLEEYDATNSPGLPPMRAMLLHLSHNKAIPSGRICGGCAQRATDAYELSSALATRAAPPLSEKIRALRRRLHDLTQKIDVFIVVGSQGQDGGTGTYSEEDIIMVERAALAAAAAADDEELERAHNARGDTVYQCGVCPESFQRISEYRAHCATHPCDARHSCWTCGAQFDSRDALQEHRASHDAPQAPLCHLCSQEFQNQSELRRHELTCPCVCPACGALSPDRASLSAHCRSLHSAAHCSPYVCAQCFQAFTTAELLTAHSLRHRQSKQFVCGYDGCILRFATRSTLMSHIRKCHGGAAGEGSDAGGEEPAEDPATVHCDHCYRTFATVAAMKRHARVHRNEPVQKEEVVYEEAMQEEAMQQEEEAAPEGEVEYLEVETLEDVQYVDEDELEYKPLLHLQ